MATEWMIALVVIGFLVVVAASKSVTRPIRWIGLLALQLVIGGVMLFFVNLVGEVAHFHIPINPVTALLAGLLRLPGVAAMLIIKLWVM
jgi:inhibitor of the pro-sigma K processing machinery